jgi:2-polyprenyl-6-methoxyphenol hydroxylase-like FAD-dependent oxidoreductase
MEKTDVGIVGSGPTGLMAAALLVRCGVSVRIFDKSAEQGRESRAFGVQARSMELFLNLGLADEMLDRGLIASGAQIFVDGKQAAELNFDDIGRADTPYSFLLMVPQWDIEAILVEDLRGLGVAVEHGVEVLGFDQSSDCVVVRARDGVGATLEVACSHLIGADGAHSIVRRTLGLSFEGAPYPQSFLLADCKIDWSLDYDHMKAFLHGRDLALFLPLKGKETCRVIVIKPAGSDQDAPIAAQGASEASLEEVQAALRHASCHDVTLSEPVWTSLYRIHHRGVNKYSQGRVFVAGDAAHIHSPAGGQGMNTGLQDAANLAWKLALVLKGSAPSGLLDTYHSERWPVGQKVLNVTDKFFAGMSSQKAWVASMRNLFFPIVAGTISKSGIMRARAFHFISQLGIRYHDNDFLRDDASATAPGSWREGLTAGHRAPNASIARNHDVFGLIGGYRFHVLALSRKSLSNDEIEGITNELAGLPKSIGLELQTHLVAHSLVGRDPRIIRAESNQVFQAYGLTAETTQALYFIRPDGYIAYRSDRLDVAELERFLEERFTGRASA